MSFLKLLGGLVVLLWGLFIVVWWQTNDPFQPAIEETPVLSFSNKPDVEPLRVVARELPPHVAGDSSESEGAVLPQRGPGQLQQCEDGVCEPLQQSGIPSTAVTDGQWWYYYETGEEDTRGFTKTFLRRRDPRENVTETIMESTPLTAPRELVLSPDRQHVAFWLDNTSEKADDLTELWLYDVESSSIRVVAQNLYRPDVRSAVRWNASSNFLWFIADTGEQDERDDKLELILVNVDKREKIAAFGGIPWDRYQDSFHIAPIDLSRTGGELALVGTNFFRQESLDIFGSEGQVRTGVRGSIPFVQWLLPGDLFYAIQDRAGFTFWRRLPSEVHQLIARRPGRLLSARSDVSGEYIVFATRHLEQVQVQALHIKSGTVLDAGQFTSLGSGSLEIVHVEKLTDYYGRALVTTELDDAQLAAVIDDHAPEIVGEKVVQPSRLVTTDQVNTLFFDYYDEDALERRLLVQVRDATHDEWEVLARYESVNASWQLVEGDDRPKPLPRKLYEWEQPPGQWILKETLEASS